jgi:hypothetical protein
MRRSTKRRLTTAVDVIRDMEARGISPQPELRIKAARGFARGNPVLPETVVWCLEQWHRQGERDLLGVFSTDVDVFLFIAKTRRKRARAKKYLLSCWEVGGKHVSGRMCRMRARWQIIEKPAGRDQVQLHAITDPDDSYRLSKPLATSVTVLRGKVTRC